MTRPAVEEQPRVRGDDVEAVVVVQDATHRVLHALPACIRLDRFDGRRMPSATEAERRELDRVGAFSDGVFAIAITLLVLNIEVPDVPGSDLGSAISDLSDDFVAYGIGFAVIGLFWYEHHKLFASLGRASGRLVLVNTALLALIALMPFTTAVLGRYDEPLAVALYAGNVGLTVVFSGLTALVAIGGRLYAEREPDDATRRRREVIVDTTARALVFLVSIPIAYAISQSLAKWFWLLLLVLSVFDRRRARRRGRAS